MPRPAIHPCCLAENVPEVARAMQLILVRTGATVVESAAAAVGSGCRWIFSSPLRAS